MKEKLANLLKRNFIRNVIILSSGTAGAQLIGMLVSPIITRLYGPEAYGLMGTFMAVISILAPIAALTYPVSIVLPKHDKEAKGIIRLSLLLTVIISFIFVLVIFLFHKQIVDLFKLESIGTFLYLIPFVILLAGILQVMEQWFIRKKKFIISANAILFQSVIDNLGKVGVGFFYPVASVLIVFSAFKEGIKILLLILFTRKSNGSILSSTFKEKTSLKTLAKKYKDFPLYRAPEVFLNSISGNLPILLLTVFFGPSATGFYSIGRTVLNMPTQLIGKSVGDVFYPRISEAANNKENLTRLIKKATFYLAIIGAVPYGLVILFGPWIFSFIFGANWVIAGEYARWIALWSYFGFMNRPSVRALPVLSAQRFHLIYTIIMLLTRICVLIIGFYVFNSDKVAIALFGISGALLNIGLIFITIFISKKYDKHHVT